MQNTLVNVTPDATTNRAPINAGEVISDTFFAPVETDVIDGLLGRYGLMYAKLKNISATVREGENADAVEYFMRGNVRNSRLHMPPVRVVFDLPGAVASLNADFWQQALNLTDVYEYMPNDRRNEWNNQIHEMKAPDFEENAVRATLSELLFSRQKFFSERVDGIFRSLSRSHVTNRPEGFSKRMIIESMFDQWGICNYERTGYVDDLRKVIAKFIGRDTTGLNTTNKILNIARARSGEWVAIDGGALRVKAFQKGTIHLEIHPDMAWRLNDILAFLHPAAIPAEHRQKPRTKVKTFDLHSNLLPFSVLSVLSDLETERTEPLKRNRWEEPRPPVTTNPFNRRFKGYSDENKAARAEAEKVLMSLGGVKMNINAFTWFEFDYDPIAAMQRHLEAGHKKLPLVIPVLFYTGKRTPYPWSTRWFDEFDDPVVAESLYRGAFPLVDITVIPDDEIMTHRSMAALTLLQKHIHQRDIASLTDHLVTLLMADYLSSPQVMTLIHYLLQAGESADYEAFVRELAQRVPQHGDALMTIAQQLEQKGIEKGRAEGIELGERRGIEKGRTEGQREATLKIARTMLQNGLDRKTVIEMTGLTSDDLAQIRH